MNNINTNAQIGLIIDMQIYYIIRKLLRYFSTVTLK